MHLYLHVLRSVARGNQKLIGVPESAQDQSSMPRALHILHPRDSVIQAKKEVSGRVLYVISQIDFQDQMCSFKVLIITASKS